MAERAAYDRAAYDRAGYDRAAAASAAAAGPPGYDRAGYGATPARLYDTYFQNTRGMEGYGMGGAMPPAAVQPARAIYPTLAAAPPAFAPAARFAGARPGYVFKLGDLGLGYYSDLVHGPGAGHLQPMCVSGGGLCKPNPYMTACGGAR